MLNRETELNTLAYKIAKQIVDGTSSYFEAGILIKKIQNQLEWKIRRDKPTLLPYPVDKFGNEITLEGEQGT